MQQFLNAIEAIGKWLGIDATAVAVLLLLPLGLTYWRSKYYQDVLKTGGGLARVRERLFTHGGWRKAYFGHLRHALAWVDKSLGPSAWGADGYEFTLNVAFIYPFASLLIVWIATGQNTSGISAMLPEDTPFWTRVITIPVLCAQIFLFRRGVTSSGWRSLVYRAIAIAFAIAIAIVIAGADAGAFALAAAVAASIAIAFAIGGVFVGVGAVAFAFAGAVTGAFTGAFTGAYTIAGLFAGAVAGVFAGFILLIRAYMKGRHQRGLFYLLFIPFTLGIYALVYSWPTWHPRHDEVIEFTLIFLVLLPLINSIFDWLSLASTRWLLNAMAVREDASALLVAGNAVAGVALGVLLLTGLSMTITASLQTMNLLSQGHGGPEIFDLAGTLHRLRADPGDVSVWWVYFTLFSTMLPTVFHAAVASASFVTWQLPDSWKKHWLALIDPAKDIKDDHPLLVGMAWRLTAIDVLSVNLAALATGGLAWVLFWLMPHEGRGLLWLCEKIAEQLGAPITI